MKIGVLILLDTLDLGGAENLAANIAINLKKTNIYHPLICLTRRGGELEYKLKENNIKYVVLGRRNRYELHKFYGMKKIIEEENIKLIHAHNPGSNFWAGIIGKLLGIPVISHLHTHPEELGKIRGSITSKIIGRMSAKIICIAEFVRQELIREQATDSSKIITIHNGIRIKDYQLEPNADLKAELGIDTDSTVIGIVAGFREEKNHEMFLLAAKEVLDRNPNVTFLLVGEGVLRDQVERRALNLGIKDNCIFTGLRKDIPDILSITDIGTLCSIYEGIPLVVLEYMAASKPVISTDLRGVREIIEDGKSGLLVPPGDFKTLAATIERVSENKTLARSLGENGFKTVSDKFSEESMMNKIESLYEELLSNYT